MVVDACIFLWSKCKVIFQRYQAGTVYEMRYLEKNDFDFEKVREFFYHTEIDSLQSTVCLLLAYTDSRYMNLFIYFVLVAPNGNGVCRLYTNELWYPILDRDIKTRAYILLR